MSDAYEMRTSWTISEPMWFYAELEPGVWQVSKGGMMYTARRMPEYDWWFGGQYWRLTPFREGALSNHTLMEAKP